jgi:hypothetical protein
MNTDDINKINQILTSRHIKKERSNNDIYIGEILQQRK